MILIYCEDFLYKMCFDCFNCVEKNTDITSKVSFSFMNYAVN